MSESKVVDPLSMSLDQLAANRSRAKQRRGGGGGGRNKGRKRGNNQQQNQQSNKRRKKKQPDSGNGGNGGKGGKGGKASNNKFPDSYQIPARRGKQDGQSNVLKKPTAGGNVKVVGAAAQAVPAKQLPGLTTGVTVRVKNLNKDIVEEDLRELFAFYGKIKSVIMIKGGGANVKFRRRKEAEDAVRQLNGRALDGTPMHVFIPTGGPPQPKASSSTGGVLKSGTKIIWHFPQKTGQKRKDQPVIRNQKNRRSQGSGKGNIQPGEKRSVGKQNVITVVKRSDSKAAARADRSSGRSDEKIAEDLDADLQNYMAKAGKDSK